MGPQISLFNTTSPATMALPYVLSLPTRRITLNVVEIPEPPPSIPTVCDTHPRRDKHDTIRAASAGRFCPFCGRRWPKPVEIDAPDTFSDSPMPTATYKTPSVSGYASLEGRGIAEQALPRSSSSSTSRGDRLNNLRGHTRQAIPATRPAKPVSPFENPCGIKIRVQPVYSTGRRLQGSVYKASSSSLMSKPTETF